MDTVIVRYRSHRARHGIMAICGDATQGVYVLEDLFGSNRGKYFRIPAQHLGGVRQIKGVTLAKIPPEKTILRQWSW
jgi:hypothetical protein